MGYKELPEPNVTDAALEALGNPMRRQLVQRLAANPMTVTALAADLPISRPAVSRHLAVLKQAELVSDESSGTARIYTLNETGFAAMRDWVEKFWSNAEARFRLVAENTGEDRHD